LKIYIIFKINNQLKHILTTKWDVFPLKNKKRKNLLQ